MNILVLCKKVPFPATDGESIVIMRDLEVLKSMGEHLFLACLNTEKHFVDTTNYFEKKIFWDFFFDKKINTNLNFKNLIGAFLKKKPIHLYRFWNESFLNDLKEIVEQQKIDYILCQGLPMILYAKKIHDEFGIKVVYRAHNVEFKIWNHLADKSSNFLKKIAYKVIEKSLELFEKSSLGFIHHILALNTIEQKEFQRYYPNLNCNEIAITLGAANEDSKKFSSNKIKLLVTGSMDWRPNIEGVEWFLEKIWPSISKEYFELTIAGKGIEHLDKNRFDSENVQFIGRYESVFDLFDKHDILLIPLFSGAGIRIKVLEAMQYGIPFIGSKIALDGINGIEELELENNEAIWIQKVNSFLSNPNYLNIISIKNKETYQLNYSNENIKQKWQNVFQPL